MLSSHPIHSPEVGLFLPLDSTYVLPTPRPIILKDFSSDLQTRLCSCLQDRSTLNMSKRKGTIIIPAKLLLHCSLCLHHPPVTHMGSPSHPQLLPCSPHIHTSHDTTCKVLYDLVHFMSLQHHLLPLSILNLNPSHPELLAVPQILHVPSCFQSLCSSCFFCRGFLSSFSISLTPVNPYDLAQSYFLQAASLTPTFG